MTRPLPAYRPGASILLAPGRRRGLVQTRGQSGGTPGAETEKRESDHLDSVADLARQLSDLRHEVQRLVDTDTPVRIPPKANTLSAPSRTPVPVKPNTIGAKRRGKPAAQ
jgi:hypothetical protein